MSKTKSISSPKTWAIKRKTNKFVVTARPGPHSKKNSLPLLIILRDILKYGETSKEVRTILNNRIVSVDGRIVRDHAFPVGFMDILSVGNENFIVLADHHGTVLKKIKKTGEKLEKVKRKTVLKKGKIQITFHDGRNIVLDKTKLKTGDVVVFDLKEKKIKEEIYLQKGSEAFIMLGKKTGKKTKINDIINVRGPQSNKVLVKVDDQEMLIPKDYVFVVSDFLEKAGVEA